MTTAKQRLYLIRRQGSNFLGPMPIEELKQVFSRMQVGMQDEIAASLMPWVVLGSLNEMKDHYPEIAKLVQEDLKGAWRISDQSVERVIEAAASTQKVTSTKTMIMALGFLGIAIFAALIAYVAAKNTKTTSRESETSQSEAIRAQELLRSGAMNDFDSFVSSRIGHIAQALIKGDDIAMWLPVVRGYAFFHEGSIAGLAPRVLQGEGGRELPVDCSQMFWRKKIRQLIDANQGGGAEQALPGSEISVLLSLDSTLIRRREDGWIRPRNYQEACLVQFARALEDLKVETISTDTGRMSALRTMSERVRRLLPADSGSGG